MERERFSLRKRLLSFVYAFKGLRLLGREHNAWIHCAAAAVAIVGGLVLGITAGEWLAVSIAIGMVLAAEAFNTAIERLCDYVQPERHRAIGQVKDLAAAAVLLCAIAAVAVAAIIVFRHCCLAGS